MKLWNPLRRHGDGERRALETSSPLYQAWIANWGTTTASGTTVSTDAAIANVAVLACLIVRAETLASLPVAVYRRDGDSRIKLDDDQVAYLLSVEPNPYMTAPEFWRWKQMTEDLTGNAYARLVYRGGKVAEIWPMTGPAPKPTSTRLGIVYQYQGDQMNPADDYLGRDVLHFKGPVLAANPYEGRSLVTLTAKNLGLGIDLETFMERFLGNGSHFPVYLETDDKLKSEDVQALRDQLGTFTGIFQAGVMRIFDRGLKVRQNQMSLKDADLTAQQRWILEQVCRTWRVPLAMVQDLTHGTYTNSEQQDLWLAKHTVAPIARNTEAVLRAKLFPRANDLYARFNLDGLLRGDFQTRSQGYRTLIEAGVMLRNEARAREELNPLPGLDKPLVPLNMGVVGPDGQLEAAPAEASLEILEPVLDDARERIRRRIETDGGDDARTMEYARIVLAPIAEAMRAAGSDLDLEAEVASIKEGAR